jgi:hypothetical protein
MGASASIQTIQNDDVSSIVSALLERASYYQPECDVISSDDINNAMMSWDQIYTDQSPIYLEQEIKVPCIIWFYECFFKRCTQLDEQSDYFFNVSFKEYIQLYFINIRRLH